VKKLMVVLLISVVGAAIAWGATAAFLSPASDRGPLEPRGLVDGVPITLESTPDPSPTASPEESSSPPPAPMIAAAKPEQSGAGAAPVDSDGMRTPRAPSGLRDEGAGSTTVTQGVVAEEPPHGPCDDEDSERERERCERELERAEEEEDAEDSAQN
jgi:hypothetical protein